MVIDLALDFIKDTPTSAIIKQIHSDYVWQKSFSNNGSVTPDYILRAEGYQLINKKHFKLIA